MLESAPQTFNLKHTLRASRWVSETAGYRTSLMPSFPLWVGDCDAWSAIR